MQRASAWLAFAQASVGWPMTVSEEFTSRTGRFRGELLAHCYRMVGSAEEAEDVALEMPPVTAVRCRRGRARAGPPPGGPPVAPLSRKLELLDAAVSYALAGAGMATPRPAAPKPGTGPRPASKL